jgi:glycosyltransferase involved in cell wall biosynthesis
MIALQSKSRQRQVKVLHLITHLGVGGALDNTLLTVERLSRDRYQVDLAAGHLPDDEGYQSWEDRSRQCADNLYFVPTLQRQVHPVRDLKAVRYLTKFIREQGYEIVHTHCAKAGVLGRIAARRAGVPIVIHTCHAFGSQVTRTGSGLSLRGLVSAGKGQLFTSLEQYAGKLSDRIITVCDQNKQQAIDQKLGTADQITTIYSGIDLERFNVRGSRTEICDLFDLDAKRPLVALIGRLAEQKAPLDFVAAAKRVLQDRPDAQFLIAGDGPLADQVIDAIRDEPRIKCLGFYEQVPELMSVLDVLALSSLWEGLGRSVTEAMIMGVPVAATAVDGVPELVHHEKTGLLSQPRDPAALAANILRLINQPEDAQRMAREARARVVPAFGADRMLEQIDSLYWTLLNEKGLQPSNELKVYSDQQETVKV